MSQITPEPTELTAALIYEVVLSKSVCMFCKDYRCMKMKNDGNDTVSMVKCDKCKNVYLHAVLSKIQINLRAHI